MKHCPGSPSYTTFTIVRPSSSEESLILVGSPWREGTKMRSLGTSATISAMDIFFGQTVPICSPKKGSRWHKWGRRPGNVAVITRGLLSFCNSSIGLNPGNHGWSNTLPYFSSSTLSPTNGCANAPSPNSMWKKFFPKPQTFLIGGMFSITATCSMSRTMPRLGLPKRNLHTKEVRRGRSISTAKSRLASGDRVRSRSTLPSSCSAEGSVGSSVSLTIAFYGSVFWFFPSLPFVFFVYVLFFCLLFISLLLGGGGLRVPVNASE